jgi:plastocyanin
MFTEPSKTFLRLTPVALVLAVVFGVAGRDRTAPALFLLVMFASLAAGLFVLVARRPDDDATDDQAAAAAEHTIDEGRVPTRANGGPAIAAVGLALGAASFVYGARLAIAAVLVLLFAAVWWIAGDIGEERGRPVNLLPVAVPVLALFAIASLVFFMSRVLLAVPEQASTAIALVVAALVLGGATLIASRPSISASQLVAVLAIVGVLLAGSGAIAAAVGERPEERAHTAGQENAGVSVVARKIEFVTQKIDLPANKASVIKFDNQDAATPHNVAIATDDSFANVLFKGDVVVGPIVATYQVPALPAGTYPFHCDVHPTMKGTVTVA